MLAKGIYLLLVIAFCCGCTHSSIATNRPFTREWAEQIQKDREFEARMMRLEGYGGIARREPGDRHVMIESHDKPLMSTSDSSFFHMDAKGLRKAMLHRH